MTIRTHSSGKQGIQIAFTYRGKQCRKTLHGRDVNTPNLKYAAGLLARINSEIADGDFDYGRHFPRSPAAHRIADPGSMVTVSELMKQYLGAGAGPAGVSTEFTRCCRIDGEDLDRPTDRRSSAQASNRPSARRATGGRTGNRTPLFLDRDGPARSVTQVHPERGRCRRGSSDVDCECLKRRDCNCGHRGCRWRHALGVGLCDDWRALAESSRTHRTRLRCGRRRRYC
ncbi:MAG: DUF3596 domain-containing protein [Proteobacteria bacterium]|nr:DUF3596 domain-containing protein [Pseudomonadota bacterium]